MANLVSPGKLVREIDLSGIIPSVSTTEGAIGGVFRWGPVGHRTLVDSEQYLVKRYGKPTNLNPETFFTAASFLSYGNQLYVSRAANTAGVSPSATCTVQAGNSTVILSSGNTTNLHAGYTVINSGNSGVVAGATVQSIVNSTAFTLASGSQALANTTGDVIQFISNTAFTAIANTGSIANLELAIVRNDQDFLHMDGSFDPNITWVARYPGALGNSLRVSVCANASGYQSTIDLADYGTRAVVPIVTNSNTATVEILAANSTNLLAAAIAFKTDVGVTDRLEVGNTSIGTEYMRITEFGATQTHGTTTVNATVTTVSGNTLVIANTTAGVAAGMILRSSANSSLDDLVVNNVVNSTAFYTTSAPTVNTTANTTSFTPRATFTINFEQPYKLGVDITYSSANVSTFNRFWEFFNVVDGAPGQSEYVINFGNSAINSDEMHVVVVDEDGGFTGLPGEILEVYRGLSRATDAKTIDGAVNYWRTAINDRSQYVYAVNDMSGAASAAALNLTDSTLDVNSLSLAYGNDGADEANIAIGNLLNAYDLFKSKEDVDISLVLQGKARSVTLANYLIDNICEPRMDCIALISPQKGDVVNNLGNEADAIILFRNELRSSSYGVLDSGYKKMYDRYNDMYRWIPLNGDTAGLCVRTDYTNDAWWSPAGFNRGQIKNIVSLAYSPRQADRDELYKAGVNPVVTFPGRGTVLYGDKTLLAKPSAFDRINVRRLFIVLEKAISKASDYLLFEFNDEFTRQLFKSMVTPYLRDVQGRRGITDFFVVCDSTNNTAEVIDRNEFVGDIYIKPARSINFITLNFVAVRTGTSFTEVIGKFGG
jgi:hypothetical protein